MSGFIEYLNQSLNNFTKINEVATEARVQIDNYLKLENPSELAKKDVTNTILSLTDTLIEEVTNVKKTRSDLINLNIDEPEGNKLPNEDINTLQNKKASHDEVHTLEKHSKEENKENESELAENVLQIKPLLKIVDFSKLVDPRNLELMDRNHKRKENRNTTSVIVLSSSDEEATSEVKSNNQKLKKTSSHEPKSDNVKICKKPETPVRIILKNLPDSCKQQSINLKKSSNSKIASTNVDCVEAETSLKSDERCRKKLYVNLLRIPCEEMKSFYLEKKKHNESNVQRTLRTKKKTTAAILDEKTGEMVLNSDITSNEKKSRNSNIVKNAVNVSRRKQNMSSYRNSRDVKQKSKEKVSKISERSVSVENSDDSHENVSLRGSPEKKQSIEEVNNTKDKSDLLSSKKNCSAKEKKSRNEVHCADAQFAEVQNNEKTVHENNGEEGNSQNKFLDKGVLKSACMENGENSETDATKGTKKLNFDKTNNKKQHRNKIPFKKLPVPLSDTENDSSDKETLGTNEKQIQNCTKNKNDAKKIDRKIVDSESDDVTATTKSMINENVSMSCEENTLAQETNASTKIRNEEISSNKDLNLPNEEINKINCDNDDKSPETEVNDENLEKTQSLQKCNKRNNDQASDSSHEECKTKHQTKKDSKKDTNIQNNGRENSSDVNKKRTQADSSKENMDKSREDKVAEDGTSKNVKKRKNDAHIEINLHSSNEKNNSVESMEKNNTELDSHDNEEDSSEVNLGKKETSQICRSDDDMFDSEEREKEKNSSDVEKISKRIPTPFPSSISDSEEEPPAKKKNEICSDSGSSPNKKKKRKKKRPVQTFTSDSEEDMPTKTKKKDSSNPDSPDLEKKRSKMNASDSEENTSTEKKNMESSDSDLPALKKKRSRRAIIASESEEDTSTKKKNKGSSDSDSADMKKKHSKKSNSASASEEDASAENKDEDSSDSDANMKRKKRKQITSDKDVIEINSDDSEEFSTFYKKNNMLRSRQTKKRMKRLNSDSEQDDDVDNQEKSGSEYENNKTDVDSNNSSSSDYEMKDKLTKKRRIIKMKDDSSESDSKTTRKKIKKVLSRNSLSDSTKKAEADEMERKQRILEKQKKYNQIYENIDIASSKVDKLILDIDEETNKPLLEVNESLVSKLKPHQASGIQFMWDACFESMKRIEKSEGSGCIVAHCMGLGKTLQVIALVDTLLEAAEKTKVNKILVVTPLSTVLNWKAEFLNWLSGDQDYEIYELVTCKPQNAERSYFISQWDRNGGVMIMSYAMFRNLTNTTNKKASQRIRSIFTKGLVDPGPDLVICDEGHLLKNEKTSLSIAMNKIRTRRRIVLTGTPLQNNLKEYYCMVQFVKPNLLGTYREYLNRFVNPITNGQYTDSTDYDINIMRRRSHVLHKLLEGIVQRRDYSVLSPYLPPKFEYVLFLTLTETQKKLYAHYLEHLARKSKDDGSNRTSYLFQDFQAFSRICIHPRVLLDKSIDDQNKEQTDDEEESAGSLKDFIDDGSDSSTSPGLSEDETPGKRRKNVSKRVTRAQKSAAHSDSEPEERIDKHWWDEYCSGDELDNLANSTKILVLFEILKECEQIGDKVLVFSQSLYALNAIEYFLEKVDEATQNGNTDEKTCSYSGSWTPGLDYFRLDGSTKCNLRSNWCDSFNKESNSRARLFLLSTRAGGLGINLVAANRVIIFDVSWNPSSDIQSIYRVYRFGQLKPSYIYRFVMYETMEMKIYERQVTKQAISKRVIDEQQIDRHYNQSDLAELYKFDQPSPEDRPTPLVPKDVLLADLLQHHEDKIFKYHEHQSLLENKEDETLNEEERKAAWDEFENEKVERAKPTLIGKFSVNTVQLALKSIIQRDNPTWNNSQILSIIPQLIQQLNIQLGVRDMTMYNRIAAEIKLMQEEYARKMQIQFYQYNMQMAAQKQLAAQKQQIAGFPYARPPLGNFGHMQQFPQFVPNPASRSPVPGTSRLNPNEIVELN